MLTFARVITMGSQGNDKLLLAIAGCVAGWLGCLVALLIILAFA
jgi:hypothetical protein